MNKKQTIDAFCEHNLSFSFGSNLLLEIQVLCSFISFLLCLYALLAQTRAHSKEHSTFIMTLSEEYGLEDHLRTFVHVETKYFVAWW